MSKFTKFALLITLFLALCKESSNLEITLCSHDRKNVTIDVNSKGNVSLDENMDQFVPLENLEGIVIKDVILRRLHKGFIGNIPELETIKIENTKLKHIDQDVFKNVSKLKYLYLRNNVLRAVRVGVFNNLPLVEEIDLQGNKIKTIERGALDGLPSLLKLDLSNNKIEIWNKEWVTTSCSNLQILDIGSNHITYLPAGAFRNCDNLREIVISNNKISEIHPRAFEGNYTLEYVSLKGNRLRKLDENTIFGKRVAKIVNITIALSENDLPMIPGKVITMLGSNVTIELDSSSFNCKCLDYIESLARYSNIKLIYKENINACNRLISRLLLECENKI